MRQPDGLGTVIGGILIVRDTACSQDVGLVGVTGVKFRFVAAAGGAIRPAMRLLPKPGALVENVPLVVLGGAGVVMFGMVAATGVRILSGVDDRRNLYIAAIALGVGPIPPVAPRFVRAMPHALAPVLDSAILLSALMAVALNLYFNGPATARSGEAVQ
ncbi:solute carrier family 23 protein [Roseicella aquatilis]|uniref:Purine permease n=1 Tax=Roseicella aquatilis TaxID=2527868 RepID=A0A4R4DVA6_9PROT|nr:solute carrier family 23 protein [Roseicella aquatilis]TCZ64380.1 hypothetical protein EXY23_06965 [Roseicella aquatilis]